MNTPAATTGVDATTTTKERSNSAIHSRGPFDPSVRGSMARSARVTGAAMTNKMGAITARVTCCTTCMLNNAGP
jgi:hypothetical protein